jgi:hypothetical protein
VQIEGLGKLKESIDLIANGTRDLPAAVRCSLSPLLSSHFAFLALLTIVVMVGGC